MTAVRTQTPSTKRIGLVIASTGLIAFLFRFAPYFAPGSLFAARGYDDAVFYGGALALLGGDLPYADFVYVQPPGSLLTIAPFAALASPLSDAGGLAVARVGWILIGTANSVLIGWLLRNRGVWAVVVGAGCTPFGPLWSPPRTR